MIQRWIERIPRHIQEVIRLEGANGYREGALDDKEMNDNEVNGMWGRQRG